MLSAFLSHANFLSILVAALAYFAMGSLWYSVFFGKTWVAEVEKTGVKLKQPEKKDIPVKMFSTVTEGADESLMAEPNPVKNPMTKPAATDATTYAPIITVMRFFKGCTSHVRSETSQRFCFVSFSNSTADDIWGRDEDQDAKPQSVELQ